MGMTDKSLCDSCTNTGCEFQSGIVRTKCAFYMPSQLEPDNCGNYVVQDSTTKNDIRDNRVKNELNRVKDELEPTTKNCESCRYYGLHHEVCNYCYKCSLWTEQEPTTKNDLAVEKTDMIDKSNFSQEQYKTDLQSAYDSGYEQAKNDLEVDWESYKDVDGNSLDDLILDVIQRNFDCGNTYGYKVADEIIGLLPSVTPQEPRWIPVTEKLPEDGQSVLFCDIDDDIMIGYHVKGRHATHFSQDGVYEDMKNVRAWQPLPEPYKGGE